MPVEDYMTLQKAARHLTSIGLDATPQSLWRWCTKGCRGACLEYATFGRRIVVTMDSVEKFMQESGKYDRKPASTSRTPRKPRRTGPDDPDRLEKVQNRLKEKHGL